MSALPTWSVMIPAYHCNSFLPQCLESVLAQDLGPARMQIAIVCDDPGDAACEGIARAVGQGRVEFYRNPSNLGNGATFNRCIALARHDLVSIVHGDDCLLPGFFERLSSLALVNPDAGLLACRALGINTAGETVWTSQRYPEFESLTHDNSPLWESLHLMPSAVVVRREVYARIGGFREDLPNGQDWEMWTRAIRASGIVMTPEILAAYRQHGDSISGRTRRTARNIRDFATLYAIFASVHSGYPLHRMRVGLRGMAYSQALEYERLGDHSAATANWQAWRELTPLPARVGTLLRLRVKRILRHS